MVNTLLQDRSRSLGLDRGLEDSDGSPVRGGEAETQVRILSLAVVLFAR